MADTGSDGTSTPHPPQLRRAVVVAALGALVVPAMADAEDKDAGDHQGHAQDRLVGTKLTITGKNFKRGKAKNSVLFRRDKGKALFVKADVSTTKKLTVVVPKTLEKYMIDQGRRARRRRASACACSPPSSPRPSPTAKALAVIGPEKPRRPTPPTAPACRPRPTATATATASRTRVDLDDDNDLLADTLELSLKLDPCVGDTDGDGVEDGFEYQSAIDLNNDDYQSPNVVAPVPGQDAVPEPAVQGRGRRLRR